jgi:signal peptidase II
LTEQGTMALDARLLKSLFLIAGAVFAIDQLLKIWVDDLIGPGAADSERWLLGDWLGLSYARNTGVAFGWLRGASTTVLIVSAAAVGIVVLLYMRAHRDSTATLIAGSLILGGAAGNALDRVRLGHVRDFIAVGPWPQFNVADAAITIGVLLGFAATLRPASEERAPASSKRPLLHRHVTANGHE